MARTCGKCVFYGNKQCSMRQVYVSASNGACADYTPSQGDVTFKPVFTVQIERSDDKVASSEEQLFQTFVDLYNSDLKVSEIQKRLGIGGQKFSDWVNRAEREGLAVKRSRGWNRGEGHDGMGFVFNLQRLSDDELRELASRVKEEAGARFLRGA